MKDTTNWTVIQYNVNRSRDKVQNHFLQQLHPEKHHVVAVQELWRNSSNNTTVEHPAYHLIFPGGTKSRTCIYISKQIAADKWEIEMASVDADRDITFICLQTSQGKVWVHGIYNPPPSSHSSRSPGKLQWITEILAQEGQHVLVGDFDLHHPRWGGRTTVTHHKLAEDLIEILGEENMELILPEGTVTWKNKGNQSTIDLVFLSKELEDTVIGYHIAEELEASSDHLPVFTELRIQPPIPAGPESRPQ